MINGYVLARVESHGIITGKNASNQFAVVTRMRQLLDRISAGDLNGLGKAQHFTDTFSLFDSDYQTIQTKQRNIRNLPLSVVRYLN
jgi:hypothetical protein